MRRLTLNENHSKKLVRCRKQVITDSEFNALLAVVDDLAYKAAVAILYERGVRVGTHPREGLLRFNWNDIDFEKCAMEIRLKSGKVQTLPLGELSEKYLRQLKESGNKGRIGPTDPIFVSSRGRISYCRFYHKLREYMKNAGISQEKRHPHAFRFTYGSRVSKEHGVYVAMQLLGHSRLQTTRTYVHLPKDELMQKLRPDKADKKDGLGKPKMKKCPICGVELTPDRKLCVCGYKQDNNS